MKRFIASGLLVVAAGFTVIACGGGSSNLASEAESKVKKACECKDFECTTTYIKWFNEVSITKSADVEKLSEADRARYTAASLQAADCQMELS